jgi:hypothetical protein
MEKYFIYFTWNIALAEKLWYNTSALSSSSSVPYTGSSLHGSDVKMYDYIP